MNIFDWLSNCLKQNGHGPFLFLGSGISRRYIGLQNWSELLRKFCNNINDYEYYLSSSNSDLPKTASLMSADFKEHWWKSEDTKKQREKFRSYARYINSPLKISISEYVRKKSSIKITKDISFYDEILNLKNANVDGVITTNWDLLAELLFPDYKTYIGQEELLISAPQNIGEIYKIHGCCTKPNSIILTEEDYSKFEKQNPYLAAKLVTIFVENPVIFMGYSLNDPNIRSLLSSIVYGIGPDNTDKITKNLIFVQRESSNRSYGVRETVYSLGGTDLPVTLLVTSDFSEVYKALHTVEHKIPVRILRYCKEQIYRLVRDTEPSEELCVLNLEDLDDSSKVEFVVGVGVKGRLGSVGYQAITLKDIFKDIIAVEDSYNADNIIKSTIPHWSKYTKYIPVYRYLSKIGIKSLEQYKASIKSLRPVDEFKINDFKNKQYSKLFARECSGMNVGDIAEKYDADKAVFLIPFIPWKELDLELLQLFLNENIEKVDAEVCMYSTCYRKLICVYDALKYGWYVTKHRH